MPTYVYSLHVRIQMLERGITDTEVRDTVEAGTVIGMRGGRLIRRKVFTEGYRLSERAYQHKEVSVVYVTEDDQIIVITAIARYGRLEGLT